MRLLGWAADDGGCGFYRVQAPLALLAAHGHKVRGLTQPPGRQPFGRFRVDAEPVDAVIGQRIIRSYLLPVWQRLGQHAPLVFDVDDDLFHVPPANRRAYAIYSRPAAQATLRAAVRSATLVTVSTDILAGEVAQACDIDPARIVVLPNRVGPTLLAMTRPRRERVTVGWTASPSHEPDIAHVAPALRRFLDRHPHVDFHLIGYDFRKEIRRPVRYTPWTRILKDYWASIDFDVGIAPLAPGRFNASKSPIKALEYAALGIPTVASDQPPYRGFVIDGETGFRVSRPCDWERRLAELVADADLRERMGATARERVIAEHSITEGWQDWERAYRRLLPAMAETA